SRPAAPVPSPVCSLSPAPLFSTPAAPPDISPLSLHDALPISARRQARRPGRRTRPGRAPPPCTPAPAPVPSRCRSAPPAPPATRSEEHTSELQSRENLVCRLLLEKKKPARRAGARARAGTHGL